MIPFGGGDRRRQGIVMAVGERPAAACGRLKPVLAVLDDQPLLDEEMLALAVWMKERTFCTLFEAVRAMLPAGLTMRVKVTYRVAPALSEDTLLALSAEEKRILDRVRARCARSERGADREKLLLELGLDAAAPVLKHLEKSGILLRDEDALRVAGDATGRMANLAVSPEELAEYMSSKSCTPKQRAVLTLLEQTGSASVKELCYFAGVTAAVPAALEKKGLIAYMDQEVLRSPNTAAEDPEVRSTRLNPEQQTAFDGLLQRVRIGDAACALIYGVTGS